MFDKNENLSTLVMALVSMPLHQHSIQNTDGIAALVIPLATYNVDHTHLNYIYGGNPPHVDIIIEFQANRCSNTIFLTASSALAVLEITLTWK